MLRTQRCRVRVQLPGGDVEGIELRLDRPSIRTMGQWIFDERERVCAFVDRTGCCRRALLKGVEAAGDLPALLRKAVRPPLDATGQPRATLTLQRVVYHHLFQYKVLHPGYAAKRYRRRRPSSGVSSSLRKYLSGES